MNFTRNSPILTGVTIGDDTARSCQGQLANGTSERACSTVNTVQEAIRDRGRQVPFQGIGACAVHALAPVRWRRAVLRDTTDVRVTGKHPVTRTVRMDDVRPDPASPSWISLVLRDVQFWVPVVVLAAGLLVLRWIS